MTDADLTEAFKNPSGPKTKAAIDKTTDLLSQLQKLLAHDNELLPRLLQSTLDLANKSGEDEAKTEGDRQRRLAFSLLQWSGAELQVGPDLMVALLLSSLSDVDYHNMNPFLSEAEITEVQRCTVAVLMLANRINHTARGIGATIKLIKKLNKECIHFANWVRAITNMLP